MVFAVNPNAKPGQSFEAFLANAQKSGNSSSNSGNSTSGGDGTSGSGNGTAGNDAISTSVNVGFTAVLAVVGGFMLAL